MYHRSIDRRLLSAREIKRPIAGEPLLLSLPSPCFRHHIVLSNIPIREHGTRLMLSFRDLVLGREPRVP